MDTRFIEDFLGRRLQRMLGRQILVEKGPVAVNQYTAARPEVFVHVYKLEDFDGIMPDGARTTRRHTSGPSTFKGFEEERPGRITLVITCMAATYKLVQDICHQLTPGILLFLEQLPRIPLGSLRDDSVQLHFEDFNVNLHSAEHQRINIENDSYFRSEITFYMNGFIHVWLTKKGGFYSKSTTMTKIGKTGRKSRLTSSTAKTKKVPGK